MESVSTITTSMVSTTATLNPLATPFMPKTVADNPPATYPRTSLLGLPTEIRLQILKHVLAPTDGTIRIRALPPSAFGKAAKAECPRRARYLAPFRPTCHREEEEAEERDSCGRPPRRAETIYRRFLLPHQSSLLDDKDTPEAGSLHPAILSTCKTIYAEGVEFLYGPSHRFDFGSDALAAYHFLRGLKPRSLASLCRVRLVWFILPRESWLAPPGLGDEEAKEYLDLVCQVLSQPEVSLDELQVVVTSTGREELSAMGADTRSRKLSKKDFEQAAQCEAHATEGDARDSDGDNLDKEGPKLQGFDFAGSNLTRLAGEAAVVTCLAKIRGLKKLTMQAYWHPLSGEWGFPTPHRRSGGFNEQCGTWVAGVFAGEDGADVDGVYAPPSVH